MFCGTFDFDLSILNAILLTFYARIVFMGITSINNEVHFYLVHDFLRGSSVGPDTNRRRELE